MNFLDRRRLFIVIPIIIPWDIWWLHCQKDCHLNAIATGDIFTMFRIRFWWEQDYICIYFHYLACLFRQDACCLVKFHMGDEYVHSGFISLQTFYDSPLRFLSPAHPQKVVRLPTIAESFTPCWVFYLERACFQETMLVAWAQPIQAWQLGLALPLL